jgi:hypothetical protein
VEQDFKPYVARFRNPQGNACGTGFLIDRRHVVTCAHVVNAALGMSMEGDIRPEKRLRLDLPFVAAKGIEAEIVEWYPRVEYKALKPNEPSDIAVLRLVEPRPTDAAIAQLDEDTPNQEVAFRTFGFSVAHGQPADGDTKGSDAGGWVHVAQSKDGHLIKRGFSGAPAVSVASGKVLGMIVSVEIGDAEGISYLIPVQWLESVWLRAANPYKGLARFESDDADLFFGRDNDTQKLKRLVGRNCLTMVSGPSGGGKSSLVFAGLMPQLARDDWHIVSFRPGDQPVANLAGALAHLIGSGAGSDKPVMADPDALHADLIARPECLVDPKHALWQTLPDGRLMIIADQFEELFTLCHDKSERTSFTSLIEAIGAQRGRSLVTLVATMRADFMGSLLSDVVLSQAFEDRYFLLRSMTAHELNDAIRRPADKLGVRFDESVSADLLAKTATEADSLSLMQFVLQQLWCTQNRRRITRDGYQEMGGFEGTLARYADMIIDALPAQDQVIAQRLLCRLVNVARPGEGADTKRRQTRLELGEHLWSIAHRLAGQDAAGDRGRPARLVVLYRDEQEREVADLVHDALIRHWPRLGDWLKDERSLRLIADELQRARRRWEDGRLADRLLRGRDLREALEHREQLLTQFPELDSLISESESAEAREQAEKDADTIWERLEFQNSVLSQRELEALWWLATSTDPVRLAFVQRLYNVPERARRFCRLSAPVVRAVLGLERGRAALLREQIGAGLVHDSSSEHVAASLRLLAYTGQDDRRIVGVFKRMAKWTGEVYHREENEIALAAVDWISARAVALPAETAADVFETLIAVISKTYFALSATLVRLTYLPAVGRVGLLISGHLDDESVAAAFKKVIAAFPRAWFPQQSLELRRIAVALAARVDPGTAAIELMSLVHKSMHAKVAEVLARRIDASRASLVLTEIRGTVNARMASKQLEAFASQLVVHASVAAGLGPYLDDESKDNLLASVVSTIDAGGFSDRGAMSLGQLCIAVASYVDAERAVYLFGAAIRATIVTVAPDQLDTLRQAAAALAPRLGVGYAGQALDRIIEATKGSDNLDQLDGLGTAAIELGPYLTAADAGRVFDDMRTIPDDEVKLGAFHGIMAAIAPHIDVPLRGRLARNLIADIWRARDSKHSGLLGQALAALAKHLDPDEVKDIFDQTILAGRQESAASVITALAPFVSADQANQVLDAVVQDVGKATDGDRVAALGSIAAALESHLDVKRAGEILLPVIRAIVAYSPHAAQVAAVLGRHVDGKHALEALQLIVMEVGMTSDPCRLEALGQAAKGLNLSECGEPAIAAVINALKFPASSLGGIEEALLEALHSLHPDMPPVEAGRWRAIDWLCEHYPAIDLNAPPHRPSA